MGTIEEMGKTSGRSGRTSEKKKPTNNLSMKRRTKEQEKAHDLKIKRREAAGPIASKETMQWGMDGLDAKGEASYIGLDATHVAVELKELNDHFQFTRTHYQNTSYQMTRTGAHDLVRIMYDDEEKVKCFKYK